MPTNLYGPGDNFSENTSHVIPALIKKFYDAKAQNLPYVEIWGSGTPMREFLHVDDLASACEFLMKNYDEQGHVNVGSGSEISIYELALLLQQIIYPDSEIHFDSSKPDGTPRKLLSVKKINDLGWKSSTNLSKGLLETCHWYVKNADLIRQ
jgi:GDP-L-fucose synthase